MNIVIERQKQGLSSVPELNLNGDKLLMQLSPNDLVYVPTEEEKENITQLNFREIGKEQINRVYKFVSCTDSEGHFTPHYYSKEIIKNEMGSNNKSQNSLDGLQIKMYCIKLKVDRLGNIKKHND